MLKEVLDAVELLDDGNVRGDVVAEWLSDYGVEDVRVSRVEGDQGFTDVIKARIRPKSPKPNAPTLGIIGRLGGVGARPDLLGLVSDADGAIVALACAAKLAKMARRGDALPGEVIIATHVCPDAPTIFHEPTSFMNAPVDMDTMNRHEIDPSMDAVLSVDATKGNWVVNRRGFAITPTVKEGFILRTSDDLLGIVQRVSGEPPMIVPLTTQDITPYGNDIHHINSIVQPATATTAPVVGVATTTAIPVAGCATGANHEVDIELAARFCVEVAKDFTTGGCSFFSKEEFDRLVSLYGSMRHLQSPEVFSP